MSFSAQTKAELCRQPVSRRCCAISECFGILLFCNTFSDSLIRIVTENPDFAARLPKLFRKAFGIEFDLLPEEKEQRGKLAFQISDPEKLRLIRENFGYAPAGEPMLHVNYGVFEDDGCPPAFLRGAFLSGGSVTDFVLRKRDKCAKIGDGLYFSVQNRADGQLHIFCVSSKNQG